VQNGKLRKLKTVLAVLLLTFTIFSVLAVSLEPVHQCNHENCSICYVIQVSKQNLKLLSVASIIIAVDRAIKFVTKRNLSSINNTSKNTVTLISQKTRLNN